MSGRDSAEFRLTDYVQSLGKQQQQQIRTLKANLEHCKYFCSNCNISLEN